MEVTIGGDRVGSGKKMKAHLNNYERSTHNLSETFASSMTCGVLYPALCKLAMRGDSFDISINADCRTIPTVGPLFGSFKMQVDVYQCPVRLYQAILHNNPLAIGLKMGQVKFPLLNIQSFDNGSDHAGMKCNESSLCHYIGLSGLGHKQTTDYPMGGRKINALPFLSYYDIFKTYYANKQEDKAYVITGSKETETIGMKAGWSYVVNTNATGRNYSQTQAVVEQDLNETTYIEFKINGYDKVIEDYKKNKEWLHDFDFWSVNKGNQDETEITTCTFYDIIKFSLFEENSGYIPGISIITATKTENETTLKAYLNTYTFKQWLNNAGQDGITIRLYQATETINIRKTIQLQEFNLSNIDDMRYDILSYHTLGSAFEIDQNNNNYLPYSVLVNLDDDNTMLNTYPLNGLVIKTYQNDIFNNWLNTEWIEGENSISEMTKVAIVDGAFSMDSLNFAQKQYNMLNRIAVAGATYEDWQDVVYEEVKRRQIESPIYVGGMSQEVVFDEIIQNAPANIDGEISALGDLGGRGKLLNNKKGGKIHVKCDEACFIIAIVSLTPRLYYTQGNEFYLTDVLSIDDMHKPAMDGIGFQDLIGERMAWWDTTLKSANGSTEVHSRSKIGKLPAWIEYMTSYDRAHGDFATENAGYMILSRRYEMGRNGTIKDATTYVDPTKFNYAFAYRDLDSQNFWVQIGFNIKARRKMSARLIPNV